MDFWEVIGFFFWAYLFFVYLMILFGILGDLFRDQKLGGWAKAGWVILLIFLPFITALIYVIARGKGMAERQYAAQAEARERTDDYIRSVASDRPASVSSHAASSPADEITKARALLDSGAITSVEFESLKARALGGGAPRPAAAAR
jgi:ABC-type multidrug transport system fused ATPase/permease subunit